MARPIGSTLNAETVIQKIEDQWGHSTFSSLAMSEVARLLGIKTPSLYSHFEGLQDLKDQVTIRGLTRLAESLEACLEEEKNISTFKAFMYAYRAFGVQHQLLFEATQFGIHPNNPVIIKKAEDIVILAIKAISPWNIPKNKVIHTVRILRSLLNGFITLELQKGFRRKEDTEESFIELIRFAEKGLETYRES